MKRIKTEQYNIRIPSDLLKEIDVKAKQYKIKRSDLVRVILSLFAKGDINLDLVLSNELIQKPQRLPQHFDSVAVP